MQSYRAMVLHLKALILILILAAFILLSSCTPPQMPQDAIDGLIARWVSLPGSTTHDLAIVRTWPGKKPLVDNSQLPPSMEIWCVETVLTPKTGDSTAPEPMTWIVTRSSEDNPWESMPLMVLSSTWPYEACGGNDP